MPITGFGYVFLINESLRDDKGEVGIGDILGLFIGDGNTGLFIGNDEGGSNECGNCGDKGDGCAEEDDGCGDKGDGCGNKGDDCGDKIDGKGGGIRGGNSGGF